jgi:ferredoxin
MSTLATCHMKPPLVPRTRLIKKKSRVAVRANYKITPITPGGDETFECDDETYILDAAEEEGLNLPYSCREGTCSVCVARLVWGHVRQGDQSFLDEHQKRILPFLLSIFHSRKSAIMATRCRRSRQAALRGQPRCSPNA